MRGSIEVMRLKGSITDPSAHLRSLRAAAPFLNPFWSRPILPFVRSGNTVAFMKTLTVKLPEELAVRLEKRAKRLGVSKSALVRESLEDRLGEDSLVKEELSMYDLVKGDLGCFDSGLGDLATNPIHMEGFGR